MTRSKADFGQFQLILTWLLPIFLQTFSASAQTLVDADSSLIFKRRKIILASTGTILIAGSLAGLNEIWYDQYERKPFHLFYDGDEWLQMDKAGHFMASYYLGSLGYNSLNWAGVKEKNSILIGGSVGLIYLTGIEVLDGFSEKWGFSVTDELANAGGALFFMSQQWLWDEQRVKARYSFLRSDYAQYRPELLGENLSEQWLKDYNGQVYWLSFNIHSFLHETSAFPKWLNLAVGYGADGMVSGDKIVPSELNDELPELDRYRQAYLSIDIDLSRIETNSRFLKGFSKVIGFLKIPAPAIEFNQGSATEFYWLR